MLWQLSGLTSRLSSSFTLPATTVFTGDTFARNGLEVICLNQLNPPFFRSAYNSFCQRMFAGAFAAGGQTYHLIFGKRTSFVDNQGIYFLNDLECFGILY